MFNAPFAGNYGITGGAGPFGLTLLNGLTLHTSAVISAGITLTGPQTWLNDSAGTLTRLRHDRHRGERPDPQQYFDGWAERSRA